MNRVALFLGMGLFCSVTMFAQTGETEFKVNDKITVTVKFEKKVAPNSTTSVQFERKSGTGPDEPCKGTRRIDWTSASQDNQTFQATQTVQADMASGLYGFSNLTLESPGFTPNSNDQMPSLTFRIKNDTPCPQPVEVPKFDISIKP